MMHANRWKILVISIIIIILGISLTISTVDTLVNAISSLVIVDAKATFGFTNKTDYLRLSKYFLIIKLSNGK